MFYVKKKTGKNVQAYQLGDDSQPVMQQLIAEGKLVSSGEGVYEVCSQEAALGNSAGEIAHAGDYIKIDSVGYPYPNARAWFLDNHRHIEGDRYEQIPATLSAWDMTQPMEEEVSFLMREKGLELHEEVPARYFTAPLWGTIESAAQNAVIVFYSITRGEDGSITDADFNFVGRSEFEKTYDIV